MESRPRCAVLHGEVDVASRPDDQDTLAQVEAIVPVLEAQGFAVQTVPVSLDLATAALKLRALAPAWAFNLVESLDGSGLFVAAGAQLLEHLRIPATGSTSAALLATSDKPGAKQRLAAAGLATPDWRTGADVPDEGPWVVKSVWEHASLGLDDGAVVRGADAVGQALAERRTRFGGSWFVERYVSGRELNVALLAGPNGPEMLPPAEIEFRDYPVGKPHIVSYAAKWEPGSFESVHTVRRFVDLEREAGLVRRLRAAALSCWHLFELGGYARVDFRVDAEGVPWILEVNANPCLSEDAGFAAAAGQAGLGYGDLIGRIVAATTAAHVGVP